MSERGVWSWVPAGAGGAGVGIAGMGVTAVRLPRTWVVVMVTQMVDVETPPRVWEVMFW
jgi:hypothetical protein